MLVTLLWIGGMIRRRANKTELTLFLIVTTLSGLAADRSILTHFNKHFREKCLDCTKGFSSGCSLEEASDQFSEG